MHPSHRAAGSGRGDAAGGVPSSLVLRSLKAQGFAGGHVFFGGQGRYTLTDTREAQLLSPADAPVESPTSARHGAGRALGQPRYGRRITVTNRDGDGTLGGQLENPSQK